jgi:hypothetical protein
MDVAMLLMDNSRRVGVEAYGRTLEQPVSAVWDTNSMPASSDARVLFLERTRNVAAQFDPEGAKIKALYGQGGSHLNVVTIAPPDSTRDFGSASAFALK